MTAVRELRLLTINGGTERFLVDKATIDACAELIKDPDAVLHIVDQDGDAYIPVRCVISMFVPAWIPAQDRQGQ